MPGLEEMLSGVLRDPASLSGLMTLVQSLGAAAPGDAPGDAPDAPAKPEPAPPPKPAVPPPGSREAALLRALAPYLKPARRAKIDRALQLVQLAQLAGSTMRSLSPQQEESPHV